MNKLEQAATETVALAIATRKSKHARAKPVLLLTWSLHPTTGKPVGRWVVEAPDLALQQRHEARDQGRVIDRRPCHENE
jgi:hypothetical protein